MVFEYTKLHMVQLPIFKAFLPFFRFFFELQCINCRTNLSDVETYICNECYQKLYFITKPRCIRCSHPFYTDSSVDYTCGECERKKFFFERVICLVSYEGTAKALIQKCKYGKDYSIGTYMSFLMSTNISFPIAKIHYIVPVPLTKKKLKSRGFNQSYILASRIAQKYKITLVDTLIKNHETTAQVGLGVKERRHNQIETSLTLSHDTMFQGKNILVVDDVYTTGTTLNACAKVLKRGGAKKIYGYVFARTVK